MEFGWLRGKIDLRPGYAGLRRLASGVKRGRESREIMPSINRDLWNLTWIRDIVQPMTRPCMFYRALSYPLPCHSIMCMRLSEMQMCGRPFSRRASGLMIHFPLPSPPLLSTQGPRLSPVRYLHRLTMLTIGYDATR